MYLPQVKYIVMKELTGSSCVLFAHKNKIKKQHKVITKIEKKSYLSGAFG